MFEDAGSIDAIFIQLLTVLAPFHWAWPLQTVCGLQYDGGMRGYTLCVMHKIVHNFFPPYWRTAKFPLHDLLVVVQHINWLLSMGGRDAASFPIWMAFGQ